jgi:mannose-1-phosphate guanylyltransferase
LREKEFEKRINIALKASAKDDVLVTLGITPTRPDTGYGYIQYVQSNEEVKKVKTFREKPNLELAKSFVASGEYVWNAGIFVWNVQAIKMAFAKTSPAIHEIFTRGEGSYFTDSETDFINEEYKTCESISIDYAVMEKADNVFTVMGDFGWSDLGTWKSLYEVSDKDENNNVVDGQNMLYGVTNSIIKTPKDRLVVVQGLDGYIVAEYDNVLMICEKEQEQFVKNFVADAGKKGNEFV